MSTNLIVLFVGTFLYMAICIGIGVWSSTRKVTKASDFFLAGHGLGPIVLSLTMMATVFSAWFILGHQGTLWTIGFGYMQHFLHVPLLGIFGIVFFPRVWSVCRKNGYITPSEMYGEYYDSELVRILVIVVAFLYAIPYVALQLRGAGYTFNVLSGGIIPVATGSVVLGAVVILYVFLGGLRATAITDTMQGILLVVGAVILGVTTYIAVDALSDASFLETFRTGITAGGEHLIRMPALGEMYSWPFVLTVSLVIVGINTSPPFLMVIAASSSPKIFRFQGLVVMTIIMGCLYYVFSALVGLGGRSLVTELPNPDALSLMVIFNYMGPVAFTITALGVIAAMNSTAAGYLANTSTIMARDMYCRYINPKATPRKQVLMGRLMVLVIVLLSVLFSLAVLDILTILGSLATAFGAMLFPAMYGLAFNPRVTKAGVNAGIIVGVIAIFITYFVVKYPLGIHMGGWGLFANCSVCYIVSKFTQKPSIESLMRSHGLWDKEMVNEIANERNKAIPVLNK